MHGGYYQPSLLPEDGVALSETYFLHTTSPPVWDLCRAPTTAGGGDAPPPALAFHTMVAVARPGANQSQPATALQDALVYGGTDSALRDVYGDIWRLRPGNRSHCTWDLVEAQGKGGGGSTTH